jgi:hypothetical protein
VDVVKALLEIDADPNHDYDLHVRPIAVAMSAAATRTLMEAGAARLRANNCPARNGIAAAAPALTGST